MVLNLQSYAVRKILRRRNFGITYNHPASMAPSKGPREQSKKGFGPLWKTESPNWYKV